MIGLWPQAVVIRVLHPPRSHQQEKALDSAYSTAKRSLISGSASARILAVSTSHATRC
jgi:hypothetical protein